MYAHAYVIYQRLCRCTDHGTFSESLKSRELWHFKRRPLKHKYHIQWYTLHTLYPSVQQRSNHAKIPWCAVSSPWSAEMCQKLRDSTHREEALDLLAEGRYSGHNKTKWHQYLLGRHYKSTGVPIFWSLESAETFHKAVPCSESALIQHLRPFCLAVCKSPLLPCIWHRIWLAKNLTLSLCLIHQFPANFGLSFLCFS